MFGRSAVKAFRANKMSSAAVRFASSSGMPGQETYSFLQKTFWRKSTPLYIIYILVGAIAVETVYG